MLRNVCSVILIISIPFVFIVDVDLVFLVLFFIIFVVDGDTIGN